MKVIIANPDGGPLMCAPDSAVIASGTPFFCPDEPGAGLHCRLLAGAVIERLGKNIQPRFAARYYSRTVLLVQTVAACDDSLTAILRDGSITAGREPVGEEGKIALELTVGAEPPVAMEAEPEMPDLDAAIARAASNAYCAACTDGLACFTAFPNACATGRFTCCSCFLSFAAAIFLPSTNSRTAITITADMESANTFSAPSVPNPNR